MNLNKYLAPLKYKYIPKNGRNNKGVITVRHKGKGYKQKYFLNDLKKYFFNIPAILIKFLHKSLYRNKFYGIFLYANGLILIHNLTNNLNIGSIICNSFYYHLKCIAGNSTNLNNIPEGLFINNIELYPGYGAQICKTSGNFCFIINKYLFYNNRILIKLKKKKYYMFYNNCLATIGSNFTLLKRLKKKKAGMNRWFNIRPSVRGVAMNPIDHPHGGGQGKTSGGRCSVSPWSVLTKGKVTKKKKTKYFLKKYDPLPLTEIL